MYHVSVGGPLSSPPHAARAIGAVIASAISDRRARPALELIVIDRRFLDSDISAPTSNSVPRPTGPACRPSPPRPAGHSSSTVAPRLSARTTETASAPSDTRE